MGYVSREVATWPWLADELELGSLVRGSLLEDAFGSGGVIRSRALGSKRCSSCEVKNAETKDLDEMDENRPFCGLRLNLRKGLAFTFNRIKISTSTQRR